MGRGMTVRGPGTSWRVVGGGWLGVGNERFSLKQVLPDLEAWAETKRIQINVTEVKWVRK